VIKLTQPSRPSQERCKAQGESGSVIAEFLVCFPAFLLICFFLFEVCLISIDKHILRLATYEAARVYAAADRSEYNSQGLQLTNPCEFPSAKEQARIAVVKKLASVAPPIDLLVAKAVRGLPSLPYGDISTQINNVLPGFAKRLISRGLSASFLTKIQCHYDAENNLINVQVIYDRILETPVVNRVIYKTHEFLKKQEDEKDIDFDPLIEQTKILLTDQNIKSNLSNLLSNEDSSKKESALKAFQQLLEGNSTDFNIPILNIVSSQDPEGKAKQKMDTLVKAAKIAATVLTLESEIYWRLPLSSKVSLIRELQTKLKFVKGNPQADSWKGNIFGTIKLDGSHRTWAMELSNPSQYLNHEKGKMK